MTPLARILVLTALYCGSLYGVTVRAEAVHPSLIGIQLLQPNDPGFQEAVSHLLPASALSNASTFLAASVVVENHRSTALLALTVRFIIHRGTEKGTAAVHQIQNGFLTSILEPGASVIVAVDRGGFAKSTLGMPSTPMSPPIETATLITASLDSAVFSDGAFVGPDESGMYANNLGQLQAEEKVCSWLIADGGRDDRLRSILESGDEQIYAAITENSSAPTLKSLATGYKVRLATVRMSMLSDWKRNGYASVAGHCRQMQESAAKALAFIHRSNP